jgi:hypothetical protein
MAAIFSLPRQPLIDAAGNLVPGGSVAFFTVGTTTPKDVYDEDGDALEQPVEADSAGLLPVIYMDTGPFKLVAYDDEGAELWTADNLDSGIPAADGAVPIANGGTGATSAAQALTNLGAASQTDVDTLSTSVSDMEQQIDDVGGELGALAGLDKITRDHLDTGFGVVVPARSLVASTASVVTCSGTIPYDDSIPAISEGTQVLSGSYTPKSASSSLEIECMLFASMSTSQNACVALFKDTDNDAIAAAWQRYDSANIRGFRLVHNMASWGTTPSTLQIRAGGASGTLYVNGNASGTRVGGGVLLAYLRIIERETK